MTEMTENSSAPESAKKKVKSKANRRASSAKRGAKSRNNHGGARTGAGRRGFRPSVEQRLVVEEMKFCGESDEVIARAIGIDVDTLRQHFVDELADGHAQRRKEVISMMFKEARAGNVSAIRRLEEIGRTARSGKPEREPAPPKLGKKAEQQNAAERVAGKYATPEPPRLVVSNS